MKLFLRYLLLLSIVLTGRYEYLHAQTGLTQRFAEMESQKPPRQARELLKAVELNEEDDDDDKRWSVKKAGFADAQLASTHYATLPPSVSEAVAAFHPKSDRSDHSTLPRYILFGVFLI